VKKSRKNMNRLKSGSSLKFRHLSNGIRGTAPDREAFAIKFSMGFLSNVLPTFLRGAR
jgi:hypothetical protein